MGRFIMAHINNPVPAEREQKAMKSPRTSEIRSGDTPEFGLASTRGSSAA
jgi:hypothetical protein